MMLQAPDAAGLQRRRGWSSHRFAWMARVDSRRSFALMGCGAVLGLVIAGFGLFTAKGTAFRGLPAEDAALVNQRPILMSDYTAAVEAASGQPYGRASAADKRKALDDMIREELFVQRGLELDFPSSDPDTRAALSAAVEQQVASDVTSQKVSDDELRAFYDAHRDRYASEGEITVRDLLLPGGTAGPQSLVRAQQAVAALRAHQAVEGVMAKSGLKDTGRTADGEEFYFAAKIHLGPKVFAAAARTPSGGVSDPVSDADGWHVLVVDKNTPPVAQDFEDARERVLNDYKRDAQQRIERADERYLRSKADVVVAPGLPH
jgi:parvulin-like peptidyl-prolyl isomerase